MRGWAGRALATARRSNSAPLTAAAAAAAAWAGALDGAIPEAQAIPPSEAAGLVDSMSDQELALRLDAAVNLGGAELYLDRFEEAGGASGACNRRRESDGADRHHPDRLLGARAG